MDANNNNTGTPRQRAFQFFQNLNNGGQNNNTQQQGNQAAHTAQAGAITTATGQRTVQQQAPAAAPAKPKAAAVKHGGGPSLPPIQGTNHNPVAQSAKAKPGVVKAGGGRALPPIPTTQEPLFVLGDKVQDGLCIYDNEKLPKIVPRGLSLFRIHGNPSITTDELEAFLKLTPSLEDFGIIDNTNLNLPAKIAFTNLKELDLNTTSGITQDRFDAFLQNNALSLEVLIIKGRNHLSLPAKIAFENLKAIVIDIDLDDSSSIVRDHIISLISTVKDIATVKVIEGLSLHCPFDTNLIKRLAIFKKQNPQIKDIDLQKIYNICEDIQSNVINVETLEQMQKQVERQGNLCNSLCVELNRPTTYDPVKEKAVMALANKIKEKLDSLINPTLNEWAIKCIRKDIEKLALEAIAVVNEVSQIFHDEFNAEAILAHLIKKEWLNGGNDPEDQQSYKDFLIYIQYSDRFNDLFYEGYPHHTLPLTILDDLEDCVNPWPSVESPPDDASYLNDFIPIFRNDSINRIFDQAHKSLNQDIQSIYDASLSISDDLLPSSSCPTYTLITSSSKKCKIIGEKLNRYTSSIDSTLTMNLANQTLEKLLKLHKKSKSDLQNLTEAVASYSQEIGSQLKKGIAMIGAKLDEVTAEGQKLQSDIMLRISTIKDPELKKIYLDQFKPYYSDWMGLFIEQHEFILEQAKNERSAIKLEKLLSQLEVRRNEVRKGYLSIKFCNQYVIPFITTSSFYQKRGKKDTPNLPELPIDFNTWSLFQTFKHLYSFSENATKPHEVHTDNQWQSYLIHPDAENNLARIAHEAVDKAYWGLEGMFPELALKKAILFANKGIWNLTSIHEAPKTLTNADGTTEEYSYEYCKNLFQAKLHSLQDAKDEQGQKLIQDHTYLDNTLFNTTYNANDWPKDGLFSRMSESNGSLSRAKNILHWMCESEDLELIVKICTQMALLSTTCTDAVSDALTAAEGFIIEKINNDDPKAKMHLTLRNYILYDQEMLLRVGRELNKKGNLFNPEFELLETQKYLKIAYNHVLNLFLLDKNMSYQGCATIESIEETILNLIKGMDLTRAQLTFDEVLFQSEIAQLGHKRDLYITEVQKNTPEVEGDDEYETKRTEMIHKKIQAWDNQPANQPKTYSFAKLVEEGILPKEALNKDVIKALNS